MVVRPSGTEPKLKAYLEVVEPVADGDIAAARERAAATLAALRTEVTAASASSRPQSRRRTARVGGHVDCSAVTEPLVHG